MDELVSFLDQNKAENIVTINLKDRSAMTDQMVIATGTSARFIGALASKLEDFLHAHGRKRISLEGMTACDWVLIDADDIVIHLFRPDIRTLYNLEKMWGE